MKKIFIFALIGCLVLSLAACGDSKPAETKAPQETQGKIDTDETQPQAQQSTESNYSFTYKGVTITLDAPAEPIVEALGEPKNYSESASCAFQGLDKTYFYGSFYMDTYPMEGKDFVYGWWFVDDSITTEEGIYIGATQAQAEAAYGAESFNGSNAYIVARGNGTLTVIIENGVVSSIQYDLVIE